MIILHVHAKVCKYIYVCVCVYIYIYLYICFFNRLIYVFFSNTYFERMMHGIYFIAFNDQFLSAYLKEFKTAISR